MYSLYLISVLACLCSVKVSLVSPQTLTGLPTCPNETNLTSTECPQLPANTIRFIHQTTCECPCFDTCLESEELVFIPEGRYAFAECSLITDPTQPLDQTQINIKYIAPGCSQNPITIEERTLVGTCTRINNFFFDLAARSRVEIFITNFTRENNRTHIVCDIGGRLRDMPECLRNMCGDSTAILITGDNNIMSTTRSPTDPTTSDGGNSTDSTTTRSPESTTDPTTSDGGNSTDSTTTTTSGTTLSTETIIIIVSVVGGVLLFGLLVALIVSICCCCRYKRAQGSSQNNTEKETPKVI